MRQLSILVIILLISTSAIHSSSANELLKIKNLRIEYHENPSGLDVEKPRFSWVLEAEGRNRSQSAYQIVVASSAQKLNAGDGDIWDSGKVNSDKTNQIVYEGVSLESGSKYFWKVKTWDENGVASDWSTEAHWSMGLLNFSDWGGKFIGLDVGHQTGNKYDSLYLPPARYLRKSFNVQKKINRNVVSKMGKYM